MSDFRRRKAKERLQEARAALARDDLAAAADAFAAGLRLDPDDHRGWEQWAEALERQGKLIESGRVLVEARSIHGDDPALTLALVHADIETGQFARARELLAELRPAWPDQRPPIAYLARLLRDIREYTELADLLDEALAGPFAHDTEFETLRDACHS